MFYVKFFSLFLSFHCVIGQKSGCDSILSWQCKNGECIGIGERCNGISDCTDGSDETVRECISFQCSETKFRCTYGACVNKTSECDGAKDCHDNSGILLFCMHYRHTFIIICCLIFNLIFSFRWANREMFARHWW